MKKLEPLEKKSLCKVLIEIEKLLTTSEKIRDKIQDKLDGEFNDMDDVYDDLSTIQSAFFCTESLARRILHDYREICPKAAMEPK